MCLKKHFLGLMSSRCPWPNEGRESWSKEEKEQIIIHEHLHVGNYLGKKTAPKDCVPSYLVSVVLMLSESCRDLSGMV